MYFTITVEAPKRCDRWDYQTHMETMTTLNQAPFSARTVPWIAHCRGVSPNKFTLYISAKSHFNDNLQLRLRAFVLACPLHHLLALVACTIRQALRTPRRVEICPQEKGVRRYERMMIPLMDIHEYPLISTDVPDFPWKPIDIHK